MGRLEMRGWLERLERLEGTDKTERTEKTERTGRIRKVWDGLGRGRGSKGAVPERGEKTK